MLRIIQNMTLITWAIKPMLFWAYWWSYQFLEYILAKLNLLSVWDLGVGAINFGKACAFHV